MRLMPETYRQPLANRCFRLFALGFGVSSLGRRVHIRRAHLGALSDAGDDLPSAAGAWPCAHGAVGGMDLGNNAGHATGRCRRWGARHCYRRRPDVSHLGSGNGCDRTRRRARPPTLIAMTPLASV